MIDCALFEPDIPQNAGTILRLGACFGVPVHIVHPSGFALTDRNFKRAGMDYLSRADFSEHADWEAFEAWRRSTKRRLIALSARGREHLPDFAFRPDDVLILGRESAGLPDSVVAAADALVKIPIARGNRSLNVAVAASIAVFEALRQTGLLT
jgi:tRNA (cytidine/uridine-2'-O-)-methyltransferase